MLYCYCNHHITIPGFECRCSGNCHSRGMSQLKILGTVYGYLLDTEDISFTCKSAHQSKLGLP